MIVKKITRDGDAIISRMDPVTDRDAIYGILPARLGRDDEYLNGAYMNPRALFYGLLLGAVGWGVIFFLIWLVASIL